MGITVERLIATLEARFDKYEKALDKAVGQTNRQFTSIERRGKQMESRMSAIGSGFARSFAASLAAGVSVDALQKLIDTSKRITNALKVAGLSGDDLTKVYDKLFASAQKNAAPLESLVTLYGRAAIVQKELGVTSEELLSFTDNVALALRVAGTDAQSASGALLQLSQALGSGVVRAEEFNSVLEGALPIAQAAAAGLKEAGGSVAKLRALVVDGKVSSEAFFRAFEAGSVILQEKVAGSELTVSQAFVRMQNVLVDAAGKFDKTTGASNATVEALGKLASIVNGLSDVFEAAADGPMGSYIQKLGQIVGLVLKLEPLSRSLGNLFDPDTLAGIAGALNPATGPKDVRVAGGKSGRVGKDPVQARIDAAFGSGAGIKTVSIADYAAPTKKKSGGRTRQNEFQRETAQVRERTAAIQAETAAQAGLNPLIDDYGYALEKARTKQDLLSAAKKAGLAITPQLKDEIDKLAEGYANASVAANQLAESQDKARAAAEEMRGLAKDVLGGFIDDLRAGKDGAEALSNALNKVADKLLDIALNSLFSGKGGLFGGGGLLGGILIPGILHSGGVAGRDGYGHGRAVSPTVFAGAPRYHSGGVVGLRPGEVPAILQRGEVVLPKGSRVGAGQTEVVRVVLQDDSGRMADIADQRFRMGSGTLVQISVQQSLKATRQQMPGLIANAQTRQM